MAAESYYVITFSSTHAALAFERFALEAGINVQIIPVPRQISSSCGLAGRISKSDFDKVQKLCHQKHIKFENVFKISGKKSIKPVKII